MTTVALTTLEQTALAALQEESRGNGHDFGLMELVKWEGDRKQLGGLITTLKAKGVITWIEETETNGGPKRGGERWTQYCLAEQYHA